ncbi:MAG: tyrosine-type recombinase/integrase [Aliihoeflea sp.]
MAGKRALSQREVDAIKEDGHHRVDRNLFLNIRQRDNTRSYQFIWDQFGQSNKLGMGGARDVSVADVRLQADQWRLDVRRGVDLKAKVLAERQARKEASAPAARRPTFEQCAKDYIADHEKSWKNEKHAAQWSSTLRDYVYPVFGKLPVDQVDVDHVVKVLRPIWYEKPETAGRVRGRIATVLDWAKARRLRDGDNPAAKDGPLAHLLPPLSRVQKIEPHAAVPYVDVPEVVARLREMTTTGSKALMFTILTAARTGETIGATWDEVDIEGKLWTVPAERMKAGREHQVPLAAPTIELLESLPREGAHLFPGARRPTLSNMTMLKSLRSIRDDGATTHGFRSAFSTWAREQTDYSPEVIEAALAHKQPDKVVAAYARTTYLDRRRALMEDWAAFCLSG